MNLEFEEEIFFGMMLMTLYGRFKWNQAKMKPDVNTTVT